MTLSDSPSTESDWFRALLDAADEVYFRYALVPARGFVYLSPSIRALTGHDPDAFYQDASLCPGLIVREDRRVLWQILRARRGLAVSLRVVREGAVLTVDVRTVAAVRGRRVVAVEGMVRVASADGARARQAHGMADAPSTTGSEPTPQRLAALMYEVHELLHRVLPTPDRHLKPGGPNVICLGELSFDLDRLVVTDAGRPVALTSRELMVLRYLLLRPGRVVSRTQLLTDVWGYVYTGDDRTVDVHVSRLRRKLPSLGSRLVAIKHLGYRLDADEERVA